MNEYGTDRTSIFTRNWQRSYPQVIAKIRYYFHIPPPLQEGKELFSDCVDADEVLSAVLWKSYNAFVGGSHEIQNFQAWVLTITERVCIDHFRNKRYFIPYDRLASETDFEENNYNEEELETKVSSVGGVSMLEELEMDDIKLVAPEIFEKPIQQSIEATPFNNIKKIRFDEDLIETSFQEAHKKRYLSKIQYTILSKWLFIQSRKKSQSESNDPEVKQRQKKMDWSQIAKILKQKETYCALEYSRAIDKWGVFLLTHKQEYFGGAEQFTACYNWILQNPPPSFSDKEKIAFRREVLKKEKPSRRAVKTVENACRKVAKALYTKGIVDHAPIFDFIS